MKDEENGKLCRSEIDESGRDLDLEIDDSKGSADVRWQGCRDRVWWFRRSMCRNSLQLKAIREMSQVVWLFRT